MNYDNPAARLYAIITKGREYPLSSPCRDVWSKILDVDINNTSMLTSRLGKVMELTETTIAAIKEQYPDYDKDSYAHWESQVNNAFWSQNLNSDWNSFISCIDDHSIRYLKLTADLLHAAVNTKLIAREEFLAIIRSLEEILETVISGDLPDEIKKFIVRSIRRILISIEEYNITGALPILDVVESTIGHAHVDIQYRNFLKDTDLGKRLVEALGVVANMVTVAVGLPQLGNSLLLLK